MNLIYLRFFTVKYAQLLSVFLIFLFSVPVASAEELFDYRLYKAKKYGDAGNYPLAIEWTKKSIRYSQKKFGNTSQKTLIPMGNLAFYLDESGQDEEAEKAYLNSIALSKLVLGGTDASTMILLKNLGLFYQGRNQHKKATTYLAESLAIRKKLQGPHYLDTLVSTLQLAHSYLEVEQFEPAISLLSTNIDAMLNVFGEPQFEILKNIDYEYICTLQKDYIPSLALLEQTYSLMNKIKTEKDSSVIYCMTQLATLYGINEQFDKAEALSEKQLVLARKMYGPNHFYTLFSQTSLAKALSMSGNNNHAEALLLKVLSFLKKDSALNIQKNLEKRQQLHRMALGDLANIYIKQRRYGQAKSLLEKKLSLRLKNDEEDFESLETKRSIAIVVEAQGHYDQAYSLFIENFLTSKELLGLNHAVTLLNMSDLAMEHSLRGEHNQAISLYSKVLEITKEENHKGKKLDIISPVASLGNAYVKQGSYDLAEPLFLQALTLSREKSDISHPRKQDILSSLIHLYLQTGQPKQAELFYKQRLLTTSSLIQESLWSAGEKTRDAYLKKYRADDYMALTLFDQSPSHDNAHRALALSLTRKGVLLQIASQVQAVSRSTNDPELRELAQSLMDNRQQLASLTLSGKAKPEYLQTLSELINQQQAKLARYVQQLAQSSQSVSPEQVIQGLAEHSAFIDFLIYRSFSPNKKETRLPKQLLALVVTKDSPIKLVSLGALAPIEADIKKLQKSMARASEKTGYDTHLSNLYQSIWKPLQPYIKDRKQVFVAPDGALNVLPFTALIDDNQQYLIESVNVKIVSSGRDIVLPPSKASTTSPAIFAGALYDPSQAKSYSSGELAKRSQTVSKRKGNLHFGPLPHALEEGQRLSELLEAYGETPDYYELADATERALNQIKSPRILHLATHGFFLEDLPVPEADSYSTRKELPKNKTRDPAPSAVTNPLLRSGLALVNANIAIQKDVTQDGVLTAEEVLNLELSGTELVVLSACETGLGEVTVSQGVYGLKRAFQEAGAQSVMSTLWSVNDESSKIIMERFYQNLLEGDKSQAALHKAQLELLNSDNWKHPFYWAPYTITGAN